MALNKEQKDEELPEQFIPGFGYARANEPLCWYCILPLEAPFLLSTVPVGLRRVKRNIPLHPRCNGLYRAEQQAKTSRYLSLFLGILGLTIGLMSLLH